MRTIVCLPLIAIVLVSCDMHMERKYLSSKVDESSIQEMSTSADDDIFFNKPNKVIEDKIIIPPKFEKKISLIMNEELPVKSAICGMASKLGIDIQMDPNIKAGVIVQASDRRFIDVLDMICDMSELRYTILGDSSVKIVNDTPYTETYDIQFLNLSRDSENKISIATDVSSTSSAEQDRSGGHSQDSTVTIRAKNDFWNELDEGIRLIVGGDQKSPTRYSINRQSGVVVVCANSKVQSCVGRYIERIKRSMSSQVLIEAKIIEVDLKNEYKRGIDWNIVSKRGAIKANLANVSAKSTMIFSHRINGMRNVLSALEEFGAMRTISNPRITTMNNQAAVLKVAQNHVYFKLNYDKTYASSDSKREDIAVSSDIKTIPIGLVLFVQPSIDPSNRTVTLFLRPTITKLAGTVQDPAVDIAIRSINSDDKSKYEPSKIPITEVREVASILKLNDGEIAVLGGFMEIRSSKEREGLPGVKDIPLIGEIASSQNLGDAVVELVILIRVRIVDSEHEVAAADTRLQRFVQDPRPFVR